MISHLEHPMNLGSKEEVVLFPEIDRVKFFLSLTRPHSQMIIRIHIFDFKKQANKETNKQNKNTNKAKETKGEKRIFPENRLRKLRPPGWRFFLSPAFPETRFFLASLDWFQIVRNQVYICFKLTQLSS